MTQAVLLLSAGDTFVFESAPMALGLARLALSSKSAHVYCHVMRYAFGIENFDLKELKQTKSDFEAATLVRKYGDKLNAYFDHVNAFMDFTFKHRSASWEIKELQSA